MTTLDTRRPADLAGKKPAQTAPATTRPKQDPDGRYYARRGGPTGREMFLAVTLLLFAALLTGLFLSLIQQS